MARFYGRIGFVFDHAEITPGVWKPAMAERNYYGDVMKRRLSWEKGESINDNIKIGNQFSILARLYATLDSFENSDLDLYFLASSKHVS